MGTKTSGSNVSSGNLSGYRLRPSASRHGPWAALGAEPTSAARSATLGGRPGFVPASRVAHRGDVRGRRAAAASDDLGALLAPACRELRVLPRPDALVESPAPVGEVAEVRVDAEREIGEVAEPGQHPGDVVRRQAVDEQRADTQILEPPGRPAEEIAFGPAPVLAVDTAHAVAAASERQPHGNARLERRLDGAEA